MTAAGNFQFYCPVKIISGEGALAKLPYELGSLGVRRPMLVTDAGVRKAGLVRLVEEALDGSECRIGAVFGDTPPDSSVATVREAARARRQAGCDGFLALGGGSCMDTAKAVNVLVSHDAEDIAAFQGADRVTAKLRPLVAIPTTSGTGSEVSQAFVVFNEDKGVKMIFASDRFYPDAAFLDPRALVTAPPLVTAAAGMDALTHAVEACCGLQRNPASDALAVAAIRLIVGNLETCVADGRDAAARLAMANGAMLAGMAFSNSLCGVVHALAHAAGSLCGVPHGVGNSIFLPYGMEHNSAKVGGVLAGLAPELAGGPATGDPTARAAVAAIGAARALAGRLNRLCGLPLRLRDAGVGEDRLEAIARLAVNDPSTVYNPEETTFQDALELARRAW